MRPRTHDKLNCRDRLTIDKGRLSIRLTHNLMCNFLRKLAQSVDFAEICIASGLTIMDGEGPAGAFRLPDVAGVSVVPQRAEGRKCARSWKISPLVGADPEFPDVSPRDAQALRELKAMGKWGA